MFGICPQCLDIEPLYLSGSCHCGLFWKAERRAHSHYWQTSTVAGLEMRRFGRMRRLTLERVNGDNR